jgi:hypothetical protein
MDRHTLALLIPILGILMGGLMFLIPIAGLTARFAIKPIMEALAKGRETGLGGTNRELAVLEQRVALLEQQYQALEASVDRLGEVREFDRMLSSGPKTGS